MAPKLAERFEDSMLIIKPDYMHKKKYVLLYLQTLGYQLQGRRLVAFTPEHAAEFYKDGSEESWFMLQVILLSKGNSEAFIWSKENCVQELYKAMICYFRSTNEMDRFVHVTKSKEQVRHEITFIFPNYIYEPIPYFEKEKFMQADYVKELIGEIHDIATNQDPNIDWKEALAKHLIESNPNVPKVYNECTLKPTMQTVDAIVQTSCVMIGDVCRSRPAPESPKTSVSKPCASSSRSSRLLSSSSCISCGKFSSDKPKQPCDDFICGRVTPLDLTPKESEHVLVEEAEVVPEHEAVETIEETIPMESGFSHDVYADDFFLQGMPADTSGAQEDITETGANIEPTEPTTDAAEDAVESAPAAEAAPPPPAEEKPATEADQAEPAEQPPAEPAPAAEAEPKAEEAAEEPKEQPAEPAPEAEAAGDGGE